MKTEIKQIEDIFNELRRVQKDWIAAEENPSLSDFIQSAAILIRRKDNAPIAYFPSEYVDINFNEMSDIFRLPTVEDDVENKRFELCEKQYEFKMWCFGILRDQNKVRSGEMSKDDFFNNHPEVNRTPPAL